MVDMLRARYGTARAEILDMNNAPHQPWRLLRLTALLVLVGLCVPALISCNTTAGLGRDMQKVGDKIEDQANRRL